MTLSLNALGVKKADDVLTVSFTFFSTATSISYNNANPVFVDIDPDTYNLDTSKIKDAITPKTKVILPVHLYGNPVDMDPIKVLFLLEMRQKKLLRRKEYSSWRMHVKLMVLNIKAKWWVVLVI